MAFFSILSFVSSNLTVMCQIEYATYETYLITYIYIMCAHSSMAYCCSSTKQIILNSFEAYLLIKCLFTRLCCKPLWFYNKLCLTL